MRFPLTGYSLLAVAVVLCLGCPPSEDTVETQQVCESDADCEVGSICENGQCEPAGCPEIYEPVCGVDGQTYGNACEARAAHVEVAHPGECPQMCGGIGGLPCPEGEICDLAPGQCEVSDPSGVCVPRPEACSEIFEPVCACDGTTYSNDCFRLMAGAQKDHDGECEDPAAG